MTFKEERPREERRKIGCVGQVEHLAWIDFFTHFPEITLTRANYIIEQFQFTAGQDDKLIVRGWSIHAAIHFMYLEWGVVVSNDDLMDSAEHLLNFFDRIVECGGTVRLVLEDESIDGIIFTDDSDFDINWLLFLMGAQEENPLEEKKGGCRESESDQLEDRFADDETTGDFEYAAPDNPRIGESVVVDGNEVIADSSPGFEGFYTWDDQCSLEDFFAEIPTVSERAFREDRVLYHLERFLRLRGYEPNEIYHVLYEENLVWIDPKGNYALIKDNSFDRANEIGGNVMLAVSDLNLWFHTSEAPFMPIDRAEEILEHLEGSD